MSSKMFDEEGVFALTFQMEGFKDFVKDIQSLIAGVTRAEASGSALGVSLQKLDASGKSASTGMGSAGTVAETTSEWLARVATQGSAAGGGMASAGSSAAIASAGMGVCAAGAGALAAGVATAAVVLYTLAEMLVLARDEAAELSLVFGNTRHSADGMMASFMAAERIVADTSLSLEDAGTVVNEFNTLLNQGDVDLQKFSRTAEMVGAMTGTSAGQIAEALKSVQNTGDWSKLEAAIGVSAEELERMSGVDMTDLNSTVEALTVRYGAFDELVRDSLSSQIKQLATGGLTVVRSLFIGLGGAIEEALGAKAREKLANFNDRMSDTIQLLSGTAGSLGLSEGEKEANYISGLKEANDVLEIHKKKLNSIKGAWTDIKKSMLNDQAKVEDNQLSIDAAGFRGSASKGKAVGAFRSVSQGLEIGGKSKRSTFDALNSGVSGVVGIMESLKGMQQRVTGINEEGNYQGSRATGREAFLLREKQKRLTGEAKEASQRMADRNPEAADLVEANKLVQSADASDPEAVQAALANMAEVIADRAAAVQAKMEAIQEKQLEALEKKLPDAIADAEKAVLTVAYYLKGLGAFTAEGLANIVESNDYKEAVSSIQAHVAEMAGNFSDPDAEDKVGNAAKEAENAVAGGTEVQTPEAAKLRKDNMQKQILTDASSGKGAAMSAAKEAAKSFVVSQATQGVNHLHAAVRTIKKNDGSSYGDNLRDINDEYRAAALKALRSLDNKTNKHELPDGAN